MARPTYGPCPECPPDRPGGPNLLTLSYAKRCGECYRNRGGKGKRKTHPCANPECQNEVVNAGGRCRQCYDAERTSKKPEPGEDRDRDLQLIHTREEAKRYKRAYDAALKDTAEEQRLIALFQSAISRFPGLPSLKLPPSTTPKHLSVETPALLFGDQQIGEVISPDETYGINAYNFGVFQDRLEQLENRTVDILCHHQLAPFREVVVFSMGDNVSGVIHEELQKGGHQHIIDQVFLGAMASALFYYRLLARLRERGVGRLIVSGVSGNHGRLSKAKESKQYFRNYDYLFHSIVAQALSDVPEIRFLIPKSLFTVVEVAGHKILQSHGHEMPPSSLGIPLYSINRAAAGYQELLSWTEAQRFDYWVMGHFHRPMELDQAIVNGTMAGLGEYGIGRFKPIRPAQKLLGFHEKWGKSWEYQIRLDNAPRAKVYRFGMDMATTDAIEELMEQRKAVK